MREKKRAIVLYRSPAVLSNDKAIAFIKEILEEVFGEYVEFENCFMADIPYGRKLDADVFLAIDERVFERARELIPDFSKVLKIERSLTRNMLREIENLPADSDVLVVNDSYATALDTAYLLYENGITHVNLVPYDRKKEDSGIYESLDTALTLGERHFVPERIKKVIDIGYRYISLDTMLKLMKMLNLDNSVVNRNLFQYMEPLVESNDLFHIDYVYSFLKNEMLQQLADTNKTGILLVDNQHRLIYANRKAARIFRGMEMQIDIDEIFGQRQLESGGASENPVYINEIAYDCVYHPIKLMDITAGLYITLQEASERTPEKKENRKRGYVARHIFRDIVHVSEEMQSVVHAAERIAMSEHTVIIYGESGTGKELFAQSIHNSSARKDGPFIAINCASLPENLLESELFGYEGGAFTGANAKGKSGLFEQAEKGSIFLDEIGELSQSLQAKLLRVIQEKQVMRIGSERIIDVDVRLIAATNRNLENAVKEGEFRSDLFYRLNVLPISIPPIRERRADIEPLLKHFLGRRFENLSGDDRKVLIEYDWSGNVREMENFCTYYETLSAFPEYLKTKTSESRQYCNEEELRLMILKAIDENTQVMHGIGREKLLKILSENGVGISDRGLRNLLKNLEDEGLIEIGKGRSGMRITEEGAKKKGS